jgi:GPH family glycoside/pentoside/hexuronide:cation symporter
VFAALFGLVNQGITFAMTNYLLTFLWQLSTNELTIYALILFASMIVAFLIVPSVSARLGKKNAAMAFAIFALAVNSAIYALWLLDLVPGAPENPDARLMFALVIFSNSASISMMILTSSMMADVVEASQLETGRRSEGLFYAGYFFMQKCAIGVGTFVAGMIVSISALPQGAVAGQVAAEVLDRMALGYMLVILVIGCAGILVLRHFPITRESHNERLRALNAATESAS